MQIGRQVSRCIESKKDKENYTLKVISVSQSLESKLEELKEKIRLDIRHY